MADPVGIGPKDTVEGLRALHRLAMAVHATVSPAEFYEKALDVVLDVLRVDRASLLLFDGDGVMRFKAWRGLSDAYRAAVEGHTPWTPEDADAVPIVVPDVLLDADLKDYQPVFEAEGIRALAFIPLVHQRRVVGKFMLYYDRPHECSPAELATAEVLAANVAVAVARREMEEALRDSEQRFRRLIATSAEAFLSVDADGRVIEWNHQAELTFGWRRDEVLGLRLDETVIPERYREAHRRGLAHYLASGDGPVLGRRLEFEGLRRDGSEVPVELTIWSVDVGPAVTFNALIHDITERRQREASERAARLEAEESAGRLARLQRITAELARAVTQEDVAATVLGTLSEELGASTSSLCLRVGEELEITYAVGYPDDVMTHWRRFPLDAPLPASDCVRSGQAIFLSSPAERDERYPVFAAGPVVGASDAFAMIPLATDEPIGCLVLGFPEARTFTDQDESFFFVLAARCAAALERARLFDEQRRNHARSALVADVAAALARSFDVDDNLAAIARLVVPRLADGCAIHLYGEARTQPRVAAVHHHEPDRAATLRRVAETHPPRLRQPGDGPLEQLRAAGFGPGLVIHLPARGRSVGALTLVNDEGRPLAPDVGDVAGEIAGRLGIAVDNGRLFQERTEIAHTLQSSLLPPDLPPIAGLQIAARYTAAGSGIDVGGDFYDVFPLDQGLHVFVLGDVCGRGVHAAATAALARHTIRSAAITHATPAAILGHVNDVLLRSQPPGVLEPRFCTAVVGILTPEGAGFLLDVAVGGHPLPVVRRADGSVGPIGTAGSVLGILDHPVVTTTRLAVAPGDVVVAVTDGILEMRQDGEEFGDDRLRQVLAAADPGADAEALAAAVEETAVAFASRPRADDLAVLVLRVLPRTGDSAGKPAMEG